MHMIRPSDRETYSLIRAQLIKGSWAAKMALKDCWDELSHFTSIFNLSLAQASVPPFLKSAIIIPVPKKPIPIFLPDYSHYI